MRANAVEELRLGQLASEACQHEMPRRLVRACLLLDHEELVSAMRLLKEKRARRFCAPESAKEDKAFDDFVEREFYGSSSSGHVGIGDDNGTNPNDVVSACSFALQ